MQKTQRRLPLWLALLATLAAPVLSLAFADPVDALLAIENGTDERIVVQARGPTYAAYGLDAKVAREIALAPGKYTFEIKYVTKEANWRGTDPLDIARPDAGSPTTRRLLVTRERIGDVKTHVITEDAFLKPDETVPADSDDRLRRAHLNLRTAYLQRALDIYLAEIDGKDIRDELEKAQDSNIVSRSTDSAWTQSATMLTMAVMLRDGQTATARAQGKDVRNDGERLVDSMEQSIDADAAFAQLRLVRRTLAALSDRRAATLKDAASNGRDVRTEMERAVDSIDKAWGDKFSDANALKALTDAGVRLEHVPFGRLVGCYDVLPPTVPLALRVAWLRLREWDKKWR
jgi:hypothetical protein